MIREGKTRVGRETEMKFLKGLKHLEIVGGGGEEQVTMVLKFSCQDCLFNTLECVYVFLMK